MQGLAASFLDRDRIARSDSAFKSSMRTSRQLAYSEVLAAGFPNSWITGSCRPPMVQPLDREVHLCPASLSVLLLPPRTAAIAGFLARPSLLQFPSPQASAAGSRTTGGQDNTPEPSSMTPLPEGRKCGPRRLGALEREPLSDPCTAPAHLPNRDRVLIDSHHSRTPLPRRDRGAPSHIPTCGNEASESR